MPGEPPRADARRRTAAVSARARREPRCTLGAAASNCCVFLQWKITQNYTQLLLEWWSSAAAQQRENLGGVPLLLRCGSAAVMGWERWLCLSRLIIYKCRSSIKKARSNAALQSHCAHVRDKRNRCRVAESLLLPFPTPSVHEHTPSAASIPPITAHTPPRCTSAPHGTPAQSTGRQCRQQPACTLAGHPLPAVSVAHS